MAVCDRCERLAADNAALKDELAEWRRWAGARQAPETAETTAALMRALRVPRRVARAALCLIDRAGRLVETGVIGEAASPGSGRMTDAYEAGKVAVCHLRAAARDVGLAEGIETVWGEGYRMTPTLAQALKHLAVPSSAGVRG